MLLNKYLNLKGYTLISIAFIVCISSLLNGLLHTISWDTLGYYWYLPQYFIYDSKLTDLSVVEALRIKYDLCEGIYQFNEEATGNYVIRYTLGQAVVMLPFFLLGHASAWMLNYPMDGFSNPYLFWQVVGSIIYFLGALYLLIKILEKRVGEKLASFSVFVLFMGTNLLFTYTDTIWKCSTHNYLFVILVFILFLVDELREPNQVPNSLLLGFLTSLLILTRPADVVFVLPVLLLPTIKNNLKPSGFYFNLFIAALPLFLLQIFYWKTQTGKWIYMGYQNPAEGFDFPGQHLFKNLFYFRKGWIIYTPIIVLAFYGLVSFFKNEKRLAMVLFLSLLLNLILVSTWSVWWWSQSYGHRAMIESYAWWALPFGYGLQNLFKSKFKFWIWLAVILLCMLNIFKIWQYHKGILHSYRTTAAYYFSTFFDLEPKPEKQKLLWFNFDADPNQNPPDLFGYSHKSIGKKDSLILQKENVYPWGWINQFSKLTNSNHAYFKFSYRYSTDDTLNKPVLVFGIKHNGVDYAQRYYPIAINNSTNEIWMLNPELRSNNDSVFVFIWNNNKATGIFKSVSLEVYTVK